MFTEELKNVLERALTWPKELQERLLRLAVAIEAEMSNSPYEPSNEELRSVDEGLAGGTASQEEIKNAYAKFRRP